MVSSISTRLTRRRVTRDMTCSHIMPAFLRFCHSNFSRSFMDYESMQSKENLHLRSLGFDFWFWSGKTSNLNIATRVHSFIEFWDPDPGFSKSSLRDRWFPTNLSQNSIQQWGWHVHHWIHAWDNQWWKLQLCCSLGCPLHSGKSPFETLKKTKSYPPSNRNPRLRLGCKELIF